MKIKSCFSHKPLGKFQPNLVCKLYGNMEMFYIYTGKLRYLEFQGNGQNTSSFPKFEIANYDVTQIHVHEQNGVR